MADSTPAENDFEFKIYQNNAGDLKSYFTGKLVNVNTI